MIIAVPLILVGLALFFMGMLTKKEDLETIGLFSILGGIGLMLEPSPA